MPRHTVFGPRRPIVGPPPASPETAPTPPAPPALLARGADAIQALLLGGSVLVGAHAPVLPPTPQPPAPALVARQPEPPPPEQLGGRATVSGYGPLVQPVQRPTAPAIAASEEPRPASGHLIRSGARPPFGPTPVGGTRPAIARRPEGPLDGAQIPTGRAIAAGIGTGIGFGDPRVPARPLVAAPEVQTPVPGLALVGKPPPPSETTQQCPGVTLVAAAENPPPWAGWCFARVRPLVPSHRLPTRAVVARAEEQRPESGNAIALRVRLGHPPPVRTVLVRTEDRPPFAGASIKSGPAIEPLTPSQMPGRVLVACAEFPRPDWIARGLALVRTGLTPGAIPPSLVGATPGGRFVRADAGNRSIRRLPRMSAAMTYVTRTKAPDETLAVVFDFTNFPEIVGGATISSAVVSGPGGAALSGLTAGAPAVLTAAATIDSLGNTVAAGKGVQVALSGGGAGDDVMVACAATLSTGSVAAIQGKIAVRNAV